MIRSCGCEYQSWSCITTLKDLERKIVLSLEDNASIRTYICIAHVPHLQKKFNVEWDNTTPNIVTITKTRKIPVET